MKSHWPNTWRAASGPAAPPTPPTGASRKSIFVAEDDKTAREYATAANSPYRQYYGSLLGHAIMNGRAELFKTSPDMTDERRHARFHPATSWRSGFAAESRR